MRKCLNHGLNGLKDATDFFPADEGGGPQSVKSSNPCQSVIQTAKNLNHGLNGLKDDTDFFPADEGGAPQSVKSGNPC